MQAVTPIPAFMLHKHNDTVMAVVIRASGTSLLFRKSVTLAVLNRLLPMQCVVLFQALHFLDAYEEALGRTSTGVLPLADAKALFLSFLTEMQQASRLVGAFRFIVHAS